MIINNIKNIYFSVCLFVLVFNFSDSLAQEHVNNLFLIARPTKDSIMLRWAPTNYKYWEIGNKYGYNLERYTIMKDSALVSNPKKTIIVQNAILPYSFNNWEQLVKKNKYAAITAQAIFGDTFKASIGENINPEKIIQKSKEQNHRFSFALYSADASPEVARASGLWFTDNNIKKNEMYLYRVYFNLPDSVNIKNDTAFVYTGIKDYFPLPMPVELLVKFDDRIAIISWNTFVQKNIYTAWEIERSEDNINFMLVSKNLSVGINPNKNETLEYTYKYDSLQTNDKIYYYRIRGVTSFGEYGPWSNIVSGKGENPISATPNISNYKILKNKININWVFPKNQEKFIKGFKVLRSFNDKTGFDEIYNTKKTEIRTFTDKKPLNTNYYKIVAYRDSITKKEGFPYLVQLNDNNPPKKPIKLSGEVDSTGVAILTWVKNTDDDILGYRVFRSRSGNDEYSQITNRTIVDTFFVDTLSNKNLNKSVFYKILAVDLRQNQSKFSDIAELTKPDNIPPSIPVINKVEAISQGVKINWINSYSDDVDKYEIYRITEKDMNFVKISEVDHKKGQKQTQYIDNECSTKFWNRYKILAIDKSGNSSESFLSIAIKGLKIRQNKGLNKINYKIDRANAKIYLYWNLTEKTIKYIKIYRKIMYGNYKLFETLDGNNTEFEDYGMQAGYNYAYRIKLIYDDGSVSSFSKEIKIVY